MVRSIPSPKTVSIFWEKSRLDSIKKIKYFGTFVDQDNTYQSCLKDDKLYIQEDGRFFPIRNSNSDYIQVRFPSNKYRFDLMMFFAYADSYQKRSIKAEMSHTLTVCTITYSIYTSKKYFWYGMDCTDEGFETVKISSANSLEITFREIEFFDFNTPIETTTILETTTPEETTTVLETTTPEETTKALDTTSVIETTTLEETTTVLETTTPEEITTERGTTEEITTTSQTSQSYYFKVIVEKTLNLLITNTILNNTNFNNCYNACNNNCSAFSYDFLMKSLLQLATSFPAVSEDFTHSLILKAPDIYKVFWKYNETHITFEVQVKTKGWIGFGISPNGGMRGSDIVIGWVKDGKTSFTDRHATGNTVPVIDKSQDWTLLMGKETPEYTVFKFTRLQKNCDLEDRTITEGTSRLIWSYNDNDPESDTPTYHGASNRGVHSTQLISTAPVKNRQEILKDAFPIEIVMNKNNIPNYSDTQYKCAIFSMLNSTEKHHIIMMEPIIQKGNEDYVHHFILSGCNADALTDEDVGEAYNCYEDDERIKKQKCSNIITGWAVGGQEFYFPDEVGFPISNDQAKNYVQLEVHYDNPKLRSGIVDSSGIRLWVTKKLRKYDSNIIEAGHIVKHSQIIPPYAENFVSVGHCPKECITEAFTKDNLEEVNVFAVFLHSHLKGVGIKIRHFRNDIELEPMAYDDSYDFNFQEIRNLKQIRKIKKGDQLTVECTYNTLSETKPVYGGLRTRDEMCLAFILYYPKSSLSICLTEPKRKVLAFFKRDLDFEDVDWKNRNIRDAFQSVVKLPEVTAACVIKNQTIKIWSYKFQEAKQIYEKNDTCPTPETTQAPTPALPPYVILEFPRPSEIFNHEIVLKAPDVYKLFWKYDDKKITFEIMVKTKGWVGFGLSPNGGMKDSDVVIGWVKAGKVSFEDRHAVGNSEPRLDKSQDWRLLSGQEKEHYTILKFERNLRTCDPQDRDINDETTRLIWSYNIEDPKDGSPAYHGVYNKGTKSLQLIATPKPKNREEFLKNAFPVDILNSNYTMPITKDTSYYCEVFKIPPLKQKHHVIAAEAIIDKKNIDVLHHIIIYGCETSKLKDEHVGTSWDCFDYEINMGPPTTSCRTVMFAWAVGGEIDFYPENVGFPLGGDNDPVYVKMETHYDNPGYRKDIVDSSGLRLWVTKDLRKYDFNIMQMGHIVTPFQVVPPHEKKFKTVGYCPEQCSSQAFEKDNLEEINIFAILLHSHLKGVALKVRHFRDDIELKPLVEDKTYDFNLQEYRPFKKIKKFKKGDRLMLECIYNTLDEEKPVLGGLSSKEEMCLAFVMYYPRLSISRCETMPDPGILGQINKWGKEEVDWSDKSKRNKYQILVETNTVRVSCAGHGIDYKIDPQPITLSLPKSLYKPFEEKCSKTTTTDSASRNASTNLIFYVLRLNSV
ncbi:DgyrCDS1700 [Dimorphilus gyrociliatus]|uniref:DgyrCDS1700 n=1 Tax=Dimorphilus gyrociliatus TaxID=2664684 RepID=A0A7I8VA81_9ANNE|nr:DgyrCDS1700 [Dimorphilus gyrociliatus]